MRQFVSIAQANESLRLRLKGLKWVDIGTVLGISKQAAFGAARRANGGKTPGRASASVPRGPSDKLHVRVGRPPKGVVLNPTGPKGSRTLDSTTASHIRDEYFQRVKTIGALAHEFDVDRTVIAAILKRELYGEVR